MNLYSNNNGSLSPLWFVILLTCLSFSVSSREVYKERSIYRNVVITEEDNLRCMRFETRRKKITNQACIDLEDEQRLVFEYAHGVLAGYAIKPKPERILIIGLGGGVLSNVMQQISPNAEIVSVDIDPVVVKLARKYFNYQENEKVKTEIKDGRVFVKRALLKKEKYDWIILDAFNGDYIPEHLMTKEFLIEVKSLLTKGGILSANTFSNSKLYDYESVTYQNTFGDLQIYQAPTKGNRVIFGCNCESFKSFPAFSEALKSNMLKYKVDPETVSGRINNRIDWDTQSPQLTDQYSPANLLKRSD